MEQTVSGSSDFGYNPAGDRRYRHIGCIVKGNESFAPDHFVVRLDCSGFDGRINPGQFVNLKCDGTKHGKLYRPFSVMYYDNSSRQMDIYYHVVGEGSKWLTNQQTGTSLKVLLPLGNEFSVPAGVRHVALVAGGVGVAPLLYLNRQIVDSGMDVDVSFLMGARTLEGLCIPLFNRYGIVPEYATDDGSFGHKGLVTDLLEKRLTRAEAAMGKTGEYLSEIADRVDFVITCGPTPMMAAVQRICSGRVNGQASLEERMACGIGACMGCVARLKDDDGTVHHVTICRHGPVVELDKVEFQSSIG